MTTVLKLGGSVVTEKDEPETLDETALESAAAAIADAQNTDPAGGLILVHGGGSFGHHHAADRGVTDEAGTRDAADARAIHDAMGRLNAAVLDELHDHDVPALPVRPLSAARRDEHGELTVATGAVETMLDEGFYPVLHGDVVAHASEGVTILSGDELVVELATSLHVERVGLCTTVPGVLDAEDAVIDRIDRFDDVADAVGASDATDVTGGMAAKVRALLDLSVPASIFGPEDLGAFLDGERPGTLVAGAGIEE